MVEFNGTNVSSVFSGDPPQAAVYLVRAIVMELVPQELVITIVMVYSTCGPDTWEHVLSHELRMLPGKSVEPEGGGHQQPQA